MIAAMEAKKRMGWADYALVYVAQAMPAGEVAPRSWWEVVERYGLADRELVDAAWAAAKELLGERPCEDGTQLFPVKELTLAESAIASRMDRTHAEKIEEIKPLRAKRRELAEARENRPHRPSKYELEYRRQRAERIAAAVVEMMVVSADDRTLAADMGIKLD